MTSANQNKDVDFSVDDKALIEALGNLSYKKMVSTYNKALKKALQPLLKQARSNLRRTGIKNVGKPYKSKKTGKQYKSMLQGIKISTDARDADNAYGKVHILGDFRLKWWELGTGYRYTNNGKFRGAIQPRRFFKPAVDQKGKECMDSLDETVKKEIQKIWDK